MMGVASIKIFLSNDNLDNLDSTDKGNCLIMTDGDLIPYGLSGFYCLVYEKVYATRLRDIV